MSKVLEDPEGELKSQLLDWIEAVTTEKVSKSEPFEKVLKDGILLCKLLNKIVPGSIKRINTKGTNFNWMENMAAVQKSMRLYGVPEDELFQPIDLVEARNVRAVVMSLSALARLCFNKGFDGPSFGPKMAETAMP